jgi:hypothetical protein
LVEYWEKIQKVLTDFPDLFPKVPSLEDFNYFYMVFSSRAFGSAMPCNMLIPFADNINHCNNPTYFSLLHKDPERGPPKKPRTLKNETPETDLVNGPYIWEIYDY